MCFMAEAAAQIKTEKGPKRHLGLYVFTSGSEDVTAKRGKIRVSYCMSGLT